jgi:hypothetical protein
LAEASCGNGKVNPQLSKRLQRFNVKQHLSGKKEAEKPYPCSAVLILAVRYSCRAAEQTMLLGCDDCNSCQS